MGMQRPNFRLQASHCGFTIPYLRFSAVSITIPSKAGPYFLLICVEMTESADSIQGA